MVLERLADNPLLTPADVSATRGDLEVLCTLNPAAVRFGGEVLLLVRVGQRAVPEKGFVAYVYADADSGEVDVRRIRADDPDLSTPDGRLHHYRGKAVLSSLSHLQIARSRDGEHFRFDASPAIVPVGPYETYGCEDARITPIDGGYAITYTSVSERGVCVSLATTKDFVSFERHGVIFPPFQKDVVIFPEKVGGTYVCRHRPHMSDFNEACIWTARSPDLLSWGRHEQTLAPQAGTWSANRVGAGAPPLRTDDGWLEIIHGCDDTGRYHLAAMLSDLEHPERVLAVSPRPVFGPEARYELQGVYGNCVFSNGLVVDDDGEIIVYYGAADRICAGARGRVEALVSAAKE